MARTEAVLQGFEQLVFEHLDGLYNVALHWTHNPADAEDLVQETCLRAYSHFGQFQPGSNFKAWIFTILRNTAINQHRKTKTAGTSVDFDAVEPALVTARPKPALSDPTSFTSGDLNAALNRLPDEYRLAIVLYYVEGFTYAEIAEIMGCPIGTVMSRLCRARRKLRADLEGGDDAPEQEPATAVAS